MSNDFTIKKTNENRPIIIISDIKIFSIEKIGSKPIIDIYSTKLIFFISKILPELSMIYLALVPVSLINS